MKRKRNIVVPDIMPVGNPTEKTLQRSISKKGGNTVVEYRIHPNKTWVTVYSGKDEVEARRHYKHLGQLKSAVKSGMLRNPRKPKLEYPKLYSEWIGKDGSIFVSAINRENGYVMFEFINGHYNGQYGDADLATFYRLFKSNKRLNPTHHYPRTDKGRKGEAKHKRLLEEVFPGMKKGRPRVSALWKADLFSASGFIDSIIGQGTKQSAMAEAAGFVGGNYNNTLIARVQLSGPYADLDAMEKDITDDDEEPVIKHTSIAPKRPRGRPRKIHPIKVIDIDDISSELAIAHAPKRGRGRPRKHALDESSLKYHKGQKVQVRSTGDIREIMGYGPIHGTYLLWGYNEPLQESHLRGLSGRPRKIA